jgi:hypothetical protein
MRTTWIGLGAILSICCARGEPYHVGHRVSQDISVVSTSGARCTLERQGSPSSAFTMPQRNESSLSIKTIQIDLTSNHENIRITCRKTGYQDISTVVEFKPTDYIHDFPPCPHDETATDEKQKACEHRPLSASETVRQYPGVIRVLLKPNSK